MKQISVEFNKYKKITEKPFYRKLGKVANVVGLTIESIGPDAKLGDICLIHSQLEGESAPIKAEVVGFKDKKTILMPFDAVDGVGLGSMVENTEEPLTIEVSDQLLGETLDGLGRSIRGTIIRGANCLVEATPPDPMSRELIDEVLPLGVKADRKSVV